ncbi:ATP-binding protein [Chryseobacterium balustinum]|uniref:ATP-dependent zinc metalloprotease FtsH n=1 Tax=Chryseobacterium balustinum TaxID=246 RepID=A0AAX2IMJ1_9FLAO|nr:ATP-binding protein [Chryseobacterium balustinum]AZB30158.1 AAA family ATPase [Chryseobacterium balustinum]SKB64990.1 ATPase family associated with various cellular activities (AAA) [Chryseobacterium balustinum]SQA90785.1 ATP-dependent zinc metalloprotease FtsH [Chryseobacterium balustinum]
MSNIFDNIVELPSKNIHERTKNLVGFDSKFDRIFSNLKLLLDQEGLIEWSKKFHKTELPIISQLQEKYPLIILSGDAGTGKTISAEAIADRMLRELKKDGFFLKLSTRVRGEGLHGQMGNLVNDAFSELKNQAGKRRIAFLLIDEADAIASTRSTMQMHQEEKAAVNTLIQKIDELRELNGRAILFMSTNRLHFLDEAIIRRAAIILEFERPSFDERMQLFEKSIGEIGLTNDELKSLADLTGEKHNDGLAFSFSDIRLRVLPEAVSKCFPSKPLDFESIQETIIQLKPSPKII